MSWYANFFIVYKNKEDGKLYPFGPFDYKGKLHSVFERRGYDQELAREFYDLNSAEKRKELVSLELLRTIRGTEESDDSEEEEKEFYDGKTYWSWSYLPYKDLPEGEYIKKGYVLIDEIEQYENNYDSFDGFYGVLSPNVYAKKMENELKFGPPKPTKNEWGEEYTPTSMSEYSYYVWPDYDCIEYAANRIRNALGLMRDWYDLEHDGEEIYILCTQG